MRYKLFGPRLRVCNHLALESQDTLKHCRLIVLHHLMQDTLEFVQILEQAGATVDQVIGKKYSTNPEIYRYFDQRGILVHHTEELEQHKAFDKLLNSVLKRARAAKQKVVILEVGGYFSDSVALLSHKNSGVLAGVVEDTTFGHNRYLNLEKRLKVPVISVARSPLKQYESYFVGEAVVLALQDIMRSLGISLTGAKVLIKGYGMISSSTALAMRRANLHPVIQDINPLKNLQAYVEGFKVLPDGDKMDDFDMVFAATGQRSMTIEDIKKLKDGVILVSGGSQQVEFDVKSLESQSKHHRSITEEVTQYNLSGKKVVLIREGTPINFRSTSVPDEVMDLVFSEILLGTLRLLATKNKLKPGMHQLAEADRSQVAKLWLEFIR